MHSRKKFLIFIGLTIVVLFTVAEFAAYSISHDSTIPVPQETLSSTVESENNFVSPESFSSSTIHDDIKIGTAQINKKAAIELQAGVDNGHEPWRLDPVMVMNAELSNYGFMVDPTGKNASDLDSFHQVAPPQNGIVQYQIAHAGGDNYSRTYLVTLVQPAKIGAAGIWEISDVEVNLLPVLVKSLDVNLLGGNATQTVAAYQIPIRVELAAANYRIEISSVGMDGKKTVLFKEDGVPFSGEPDLQLVKSSNGKEGVAIIEYPSAADGGREAWHLLTAENGNIVRIDRSSFLKQPLIKNGYPAGEDFYVFAYAGVKINGDEIIETIPTNPLPSGNTENVTLEFHFKFTGDSLVLESVKNL